MSEKTEIVKSQQTGLERADVRQREPAQFEAFARLILGDERVDGIEQNYKSCDLKITAGIKGPSGSPTEKDRLHVLKYMPEPAKFVSRKGDETQGLRRSPHPDFNSLGKITELPGRLIFADINDSLSLSLVCQKTSVKSNNPDTGAPYCSNPGVSPFATRWVNGQWKQVGCNFKTCPYALKKECKPRTSLIYEVTNPRDGRPMSASYESGGFKTLARFVSFVLTLQKRMREVSLDVYSGLPVRLHLGERTSSDGTTHSRHPVVDITTDGDIFAGVHHTANKIRAAVEAGLSLRRLLTARDAPPFPELDAYELGGPGLPPPVTTLPIPAVLAQESARAPAAEVLEGVVETEPSAKPSAPQPTPEPPALVIPSGVRQGPDGLVVCNDCDGLMNPSSRAGYWVCPDDTCRAGVRPDGTWTKVGAK